MVIINADDFGASGSINKAIVDSFSKGFISSTTIMANMPNFDGACELVKNHHLDGHVGIHLVLTRGEPLTDEMKKNKNFCNEVGFFKKRHKYPIYYLTKDDKECIAREFQKQIEKCAINGIKITHIDSHHHIHMDYQVLRIVIQLAKQNGIKHIRKAINIGNKSFYKKIYNQIMNNRYRRDGIFKTDYFGAIDDFQSFNFEKKRNYEIMVHPNYQNGIIVDLDKTPLYDKIMNLAINEEILSYIDYSYKK